MIGRILIAAAAVAALAAGPPARAEVSGLILEVSGTTQPHLAAFSEIPTNEVIKLGRDARIKVVHYRSCRVLTLTGGSFEAGPSDFAVTGGAVESNVQGRCPQQKHFGPASGNGIGGVTMRGFISEPPLAVVPGETFVLTGAGAGGVEQIRLVRDDKTLAEWTPNGTPSWRLPDNAVKVGDSAVLEVLRKNIAAPLRQNLLIVKSIGDDVASNLMVIEVN